MNVPYEYLEDLATADIAFNAWGDDLEETFRAAAEATMNVMVEDLDTIHRAERQTIELENEELDMLLFDFLQEIIYFKDAEQLLLRVDDIHISDEDGSYRLRATTSGERLDPDRHETRVDVKAVTFHRFALEKKDTGWEATVILDI